MAGQVQQHPEHVVQAQLKVLMRTEQDGGDLADQPQQSAPGQQQRADQQEERVDGVLVLGVALMPHPSHLLLGV
ncbi:MAG TPA: hypothetical protein VG276_19925, partial [Actinomycetes bacterium]|nr:hypothetical protein [Actinomycetes bacterium]